MAGGTEGRAIPRASYAVRRCSSKRSICAAARTLPRRTAQLPLRGAGPAKPHTPEFRPRAGCAHLRDQDTWFRCCRSTPVLCNPCVCTSLVAGRAASGRGRRAGGTSAGGACAQHRESACSTEHRCPSGCSCSSIWSCRPRPSTRPPACPSGTRLSPSPARPPRARTQPAPSHNTRKAPHAPGARPLVRALRGPRAHALPWFAEPLENGVIVLLRACRSGPF